MFINKIKSVLTMGLVASILIFVSCEKENVGTESAGTVSITKADKSPEGKTIVTADAKGALAGAGTGTAIGSSIGGATGAAWGALIGGIIGGVSASVDKYRDNHPTPSVDTNVVSQTQMVGVFPDSIKNSSNPFDSIGMVHYDIVAYFLEHPSLCQANNGNLDLTSFYNTVFSMLTNNYPSLHVTSDMQSYFGQLDLESVMDDMSEDFSSLVINCIQDNDLRQIVTSYQMYFDNATEFATFCPYSITIETQIVNNNSFSNIEKRIVLSYMATARYGFWFWENYCGGF